MSISGIKLTAPAAPAKEGTCQTARFMTNQPPTTEEWSDLYQAFARFKSTACWEWMDDTDLFGVKNPEDGQIGYCCVMGSAGLLRGLNVNQGTEGLQTYLRMRFGDASAHDESLIYTQHCLVATLEDRTSLKKPDFEVIKELGLRFRGRQAWPVFRSYRPGYAPWYLTGAEARQLTTALEQTLEIAARLAKNREELSHPEQNRYFVRVREADGRWYDHFLEPDPLEKVERPVCEPVDSSRLARIREGIPASRGMGPWEVDFSVAPFAVGDRERPFFPYLLLVVEPGSGFVLDCHVAGPDDYLTECRKALLDLIERMGTLPKGFHVQRDEVRQWLAPVATALGIPVSKVRSLRALNSARRALDRFVPQQGKIS